MIRTLASCAGLAAAGLLAASGIRAEQAAANSFAIRAVRVFNGSDVMPRANVIVRDGMITEVGPDVAIPAGLPVVEGTGRTVLPGLIDSHVHVFPGAAADALRFGVTAELDMFSIRPEFARWRAQRESAGPVAEADVWSAGIGVSAPGGHPSGTMPGSDAIPTLASAADAPAFVAARVAEGSDYVKIIFEDNSFLTPDRLVPSLTREEVCAAVKAAHELGKLAVVHASRQRDAKIAVRCGADGLAHLFSDEVADAELIAAAQTHRTFVLTTMAVVAAGSDMPLPRQVYARPEIAALLSPGQRQILAAGFVGPARPRGIDNALRSAQLLHAAGIPLLAATDAPNPGAPHGAGLHTELQLLVLAGLSPVEALRATTSRPAAVFRLPGRGRVAPGYRADLLLVNGDPTRDISATSAIERIWKSGFAVSRDLG